MKQNREIALETLVSSSGCQLFVKKRADDDQLNSKDGCSLLTGLHIKPYQGVIIKCPLVLVVANAAKLVQSSESLDSALIKRVDDPHDGRLGDRPHDVHLLDGHPGGHRDGHLGDHHGDHLDGHHHDDYHDGHPGDRRDG
ncbi:hypothetical protein HG530_003252 [Fusarium avenaceum]|nr:hypothetical protein HG530_003252 [Fusarium avenaceum]